MNPSSIRRYLWTAGLTASILLASLVGVNYLVDPYFTHQWDSPALSRLSPAQQKIVPWAKTYAAYRFHPEVVYLGSSRTEIGLPPDVPQFAGKRVFNLAISGASLGDAVRMLNHTSYFHQPETVVWGLDFGWQFGPQVDNKDLKEYLVAKESWYPLKRLFTNLYRSLSLTMTKASWEILLGISEQRCLPLLATWGHKSDLCLEQIMADEGGTAKAFEKAVTTAWPLTTPEHFKPGFEMLDGVTQEYCRRGVKFRFYLQPVHALGELVYWERSWRQQEDWKRDLVKLFDQRRQEGCDIRFFDFSGYNRITTEEAALPGNGRQMKYYWEYSHYNSLAGREMLDKMFAPPATGGSDDFGTELTGTTIETHLRQFREQRAAYCASHPQETRRMGTCKIDPNGQPLGPNPAGTGA